ncbi:MAG: amidohydrolase family protein [Anaerolineae bacterium]|nr:amidohydrolase family protein [Anaerolineae bacterium]
MINLHGKTIYTGNAVLTDGTIAIDGTLVAAVLAQAEGEIAGTYPVITPAIIDAHSHIGLIRAGEPSAEAEANEHMETIVAHADVLDSVQMDDRGFQDSIEMGVLYSCVLPGSGNIIGGNSAVIRNYGEDTNSAFIRRAGIKGAFGYNPMSTREWKGQRPWTRMGALAILRAKLVDVQNKMAKEAAKVEDDKPNDVSFSAEEAVLKALLTGEQRYRVHVHKNDDIAALLRFVDDFGLKVVVEHTMDVHDVAIYKELAARGIPVIYGPMDTLAYKVELKHENWRNLQYLLASGAQFGLMTDHPVIMQNMLLFCLRHFLHLGVSKQAALEVITRQNAQVLGIDDILGTLEPGKWGSLICWNGDPFALESYPVAIYAEGKLIYEA